MNIFGRKSDKNQDNKEGVGEDNQKKNKRFFRSKKISVGHEKKYETHQNSNELSSKKQSSWLTQKLEQLEKAENSTDAAKICWRLTQVMECSDQGSGENEGITLYKILGLTSFVAGLVLPLVGVPMIGIPDVLGLDPIAAQTYDAIDQAKTATDALHDTAGMTLRRGRAYTREEVVESGAIPILVAALRRHIKDVVATAAILRSLWEVNRFTIPWDLIRLKMHLNGGDQSAAVSSYYSQVWVKSIKENFNTFISNGGHLLLLKAIQEHTGKEKSPSSSLEAHKGNGIPDLACCILGTLIEGGCAIQQELLEASAVSIIMYAMQQDNENIWLMSGGLSIVHNLVASAKNHQKFCSDVANAGGIEISLQALTLSQQDPTERGQLAFSICKLAEDACAFLCNIAHENESNIAKIGRKGGVEKILGTIQYFDKNWAVQNYGFRALIILSYNVINQDKIVEHNGVNVALRSLKKLIEVGNDTKDDSSSEEKKDLYLDFIEYNSSCFLDTLSMEICCAIFMFIRGNSTNANNLLQQKDGIKILLDTMVYYSNSLQVQNMVMKILIGLLDRAMILDFKRQQTSSEKHITQCQALLNLLENFPYFGTIPLEDVFGVILDALRSRPDEVSLQQNGFEFLKRMAKDYRTAEVISNNGGIGVVLDAMLYHPTIPRIQARGCEILRDLSDNPSTHAAILERKRDIGTVANALLRKPDDLSQSGGRLLKAICPMIESQNAELIAKELSQHPKYIGTFLEGLQGQQVCVLQTGCKVIKILVVDAESAKLIVDQGGIAFTVDAMLQHPKNIEIQVQGCAALANLAAYRNTHKAINERDEVAGIVLNTLRSYPDQVCLQREGYRFLRNMEANPQTIKSIV